MSSGKNQQGFTYLTVLFLIAALGAGLAVTGELWSHTRQREKEAELIWVGNQFKQAIGLYYQRSPGTVKRYPEKLEDLLEDKRYLSMQRYLRKIYADPISGKPAWGLVTAPGGGIMGIHSTSEGRPVRLSPLVGDANSAAHAASHRDWRFVYEPPTPTQPPSAKPAPTTR